MKMALKKMPAVGLGDGKELKEEKGLGGGGDIKEGTGWGVGLSKKIEVWGYILKVVS